MTALINVYGETRQEYVGKLSRDII